MKWSSVMETKIFCECDVMRAVCMPAQCHFSATSEYTMTPLRHRSRDFLLPFAIRLSACLRPILFYVLIAYFSLYLKRLFISPILVYLFSFVVSLFAPNCRFISFLSPILCFLYPVVTFISLCVFF